MAEDLNLTGPDGAVRQAALNVLEPLGKTKTGGSGEGRSYLVEVTYQGALEPVLRLEKVITGRGLRENKFEILFDPNSVMAKWRALASSGVSVDEFIETDHDKGVILLPELTKGGTCEFVDFEELIRRGSPPPAWIKEHRKEVFSQLISNLRLAAGAGYSILPDSWFAVYDKGRDEVRVLVRDLGQGVIKTDAVSQAEADINNAVVRNIFRPLGERSGIYSEDEWRAEFPEYA